MRFIVEQKQTVRSRNMTFLSGWASASRFTRLSSVPSAHAEPGAAASSVWMMTSVDPTWSAAVTTSCLHSGWTSTLTPGTRSRTSRTESRLNRPCTEQWPRQRIIRAPRSCSVVRPPRGLCGSHSTQSSRDMPICRTAVFRPRCWSGRNSTFSPLPNAQSSDAFAFDDVQIVPP